MLASGRRCLGRRDGRTQNKGDDDGPVAPRCVCHSQYVRRAYVDAPIMQSSISSYDAKSVDRTLSTALGSLDIFEGSTLQVVSLLAEIVSVPQSMDSRRVIKMSVRGCLIVNLQLSLWHPEPTS